MNMDCMWCAGRVCRWNMQFKLLGICVGIYQKGHCQRSKPVASQVQMVTFVKSDLIENQSDKIKLVKLQAVLRQGKHCKDYVQMIKFLETAI